MSCIFCQSNSYSDYAYPKTLFNDRIFEYIRCNQCQLVQLRPLPNELDYEKMYPTDYQEKNVDKSISEDIHKPMLGLRISYQTQFDWIRRQVGVQAKILDYGCGNGHFINNSYHAGFHHCSAAEFNPEMVSMLQGELPHIKFYTVEEVLANSSISFDVIRMSNVLEHLINPKEILYKLKERLTENGILIIEGPLEANFYLMNMVNRLYFNISMWMNSEKYTTQPPYHIFFSNAQNQLQLFDKVGLKKIQYQIIENTWPYQENILSAIGIRNKTLSILANLSRWVSNKVPFSWGNTFIYIGKK